MLLMGDFNVHLGTLPCGHLVGTSCCGRLLFARGRPDQTSCRLDLLPMLVLLSRGLHLVYVLLLLVGVLFLGGHHTRGSICTSVSHLAQL